jgi:hypothetical protein
MSVERVSNARTAQRSPARNDARKLRDGIYASADQQAPTVEDLPVTVDRRADIVITAKFDSDDPAKLVSEIQSLWTRAQEQFIAIGYSLIAARNLIDRQIRNDVAAQAMRPADRRALAEGEWRNFLARLPFSQGIASQLEQVVRALDGGRLTKEELPSNYSVAYQLTTLSETELEAARRHHGIVGPTATRARIIEFKRRLREARVGRVGLIEQRRAKLVEAIERMKQELESVERDLAAAVSDDALPEDRSSIDR